MAQQAPILNKVRDRMLFLSPTVQAGWEPESKKEDFEEVKLLGQGAFGQVKRVTHKKTNITYAIKIVEKKMLKQSNMVEQMNNEVKIMYSLNHPYILKLYNHFEDDVNIYLVLEFASGGQLYAVLWKQPQKRFNEKLAAKFILQLTLALENLHTKKIIHRDIKPENILLDDQINIRLCDFGWSNFLKPNEIRQTFCGTLDYLAPEMVEEKRAHDQNVDIWAVGVLLFELLTGMSPFAPQINTNNQIYVEKTTKDNIINVKFSYPFNFPEGAKDLISKILNKDPNQRPSADQIRQHPWIKDNTKDFKMPPQITVEIEKKIVKKDEIENLTKDGKAIFTAEQIYMFSRPDSIIIKEYVLEDKGQKLQEILQQKLKEKDTKINSLEVENQKKNQEIEELKSTVELLKKSGTSNQEAVNLQQKLKMSEDRFQFQKGLYDQLQNKNLELEKKLRELEQQNKEGESLKVKVNKYKEEVETYKARAKKAEDQVQQMVLNGVDKPQEQQQQGGNQMDDLLKKLQNKYA